MLFYKRFIAYDACRFSAVFNGLTFVYEYITVKNNRYILVGEITHAGIGKVHTHKPKQILKSGLKFGFHTICIKVNIGIH